MRPVQFIRLVLMNAFSAFVFSTAQSNSSLEDFQTSCASIGSTLNLENVTVYFSEFIAGGTNLSLPDNNVTCTIPFIDIPVDLCRVALYVPTSERSGIRMEAWLPLNWTGRFLSAGNGGIAGCIGYDDMSYAVGYGFASVGANNGHNGTSGGAMLNNPDVVADFAYRSIHTGAVVGKQITEGFYGKPHTKSYYLGCSTGGRQGFKSAQDFPEDFDGIVAGAPAIAFNNLSAWSGHFLPITGTPSDPEFVPTQLWPVIHQDILRQCDALDGFNDGVLEDPILCNYTSTNLICSANLTTNCLTELQSKTVQGIFSPLINTNDGSVIYPRMQPGSEIIASYVIYTGAVFPYTLDYFRYMLYNDPTWDATTISNVDYENAYRTNPQDIHTFKGDLSVVRARGAKILHWHGLMDGIISSEISPPYYEHVSQTMGLDSSQLDEFYRFFRMSGTGHCSGGDGAHVFGQSKGSAASDSASENILMAIVEWVENGNAPEHIIGTRYVNDTAAAGVDYKRAHCKWPTRNVYKGKGDPKAIDSWECIGL